ncbi:MAG: exonuclease SbcCD subunit D [Planctomycetaceae bacterium]
MHRDCVLRFIHASDFRLGQVAHGISHVAPELRQQLLAAPWRSAEACFDQAIAHNVDFVLLNGDLVANGVERNRALAFLLDQFVRLADNGIQVYWRVDGRQLDAWYECFAWPANVHVLTEQSALASFSRAGEPLAVIAGGELELASRQEFTISLERSGQNSRIHSADYVADCGTARSDSVHAGRTVHSPGSPQGLSFQEAGPHGCSLVELDHNNSVSIGFLQTNAIVWDVRPTTIPVRGEVERSILDQLTSSNDDSTHVVRLVLDSADTATALRLETMNLKALRDRLNAGLSGNSRCFVSDVELGAEMTVAAGAAMSPGCVQDFRELVLSRGEPTVRSLRSQHRLATTSPSAQLLSESARLGAELLS